MNRKRLKVALLTPHFGRGFVLDSAPLNLSYLGAVLEQDGFFVRGYNLDIDKLEDIDINNFDVFGISATSPMIEKAKNLAQYIKKIKSNSFIVLGGAHATALKEKIFVQGNDCFDAVVYGEGEFPFLKLALAMEEKRDFKDIPNLIYKHGNEVIINQKLSKAQNLDELPFPAKHIFDASKYPDYSRAYGDIIASRGCPFRCINCKPGLDNIAPYRFRSFKKVVDELEYCVHNYGVRHFTFSDSELAGPKAWIMNFCNEVILRRLKITFSCNGRTDQVDEEVLRILKKAGCVFIGYGVESGSQKVIDNILLKGIDLNRTREIIRKTVEMGIGTGTWFMLGIPGETWDNILESIEYAKSLDASTIEVNIATPWPDTGFYQIAKEKGWLLTEEWSKMNEKNVVAIETPYLSKEQVLKGFNLFLQELRKIGWGIDENSNRLYHPHFLSRTIKLNFRQVLKRGVRVGDVKKLCRWVMKRY